MWSAVAPGLVPWHGLTPHTASETEGKGETSAVVTHLAMPYCTGTHRIPVVYSFPVCMRVCVEGEEWKWEVGWRAQGMLCHMAGSLLGLGERSKGSAGTGDKQTERCGKMYFTS